MSIFGGLQKVLGAGLDVAFAPLKLMTGDVSAVSDVARAPFKATGGVLETAFGVATLPVRLPLMAAGSMFGALGGSSEARTGAQNAIGGQVQQTQSPGYW